MNETPIALDAMGGDRMPDAAVAGAAEAARDGVPVVLVGQPDVLNAASRAHGVDLPIVEASDVIGMDEHASDVRRRTQSSVMRAAAEVKEGRASALVSMGHSGATMAAALFTFGRIKGVERPAIVANLPSQRGTVTLLDVGANADVKPSMMRQFAVMGRTYATVLHGIERPSVGLLSIGEEPGKGNELTVAAHALMQDLDGFAGNVEGRDVFAGTTDVVVTDGFTGNVVLKLAEGEAKTLFTWIREAFRSSLRAKLGGALAKPALKAVALRMDPSTYGAQPLIGVTQPTFIGHGSSDARAVANALRFAHRTVREGVVTRVTAALEAARKEA